MRIERLHLTLKLMKSLKVGDVCRYCDTEVVGLQVWVGARSVSYYLRKRKDGREYTVKLGNWPDINIEEARQKALDRLGALANHGSIEAPTGRTNPLVADAVEYYVSLQDTEQKKKSARKALMPFHHLANRRVCDIRKSDIEPVHKSMKDTPAKANQCVKRFVAALHYICRSIDKPFASPADGLEWYEMKPRKRYITKDEAPRFFDALDEFHGDARYTMLADAIYMMLYTGARKSNVCEMLLEEIDENGLWTIPEGKFKSRREHSIQLGEYELCIVSRYRDGRTEGYVFPHEHSICQRVRRVLLKICEKAKMTDFHIHDLRRTLGTWMLSRGIPVAVVSKKLGHASIGVTEQVYAHLMPEVSKNATAETIDAMRSMKNEE